jgi:LysR family transcriptional regulator for bpeEF and oprC
MAPASVITHIAQLESHFGMRLVHRNTRKLSITEDGVLLDEAAAVVLQDFQQLEDRFRNADSMTHGKLRVTVSPLTATHILIPALPRFLERTSESVDVGKRRRIRLDSVNSVFMFENYSVGPTR